jgi:hypothetical protein
MPDHDYKTGRLTNKYKVEKTNGEPIDANAEYFVLRIDADPHAQTAAMAYANSIENENPEFAKDIRDRLAMLRK